MLFIKLFSQIIPSEWAETARRAKENSRRSAPFAARFQDDCFILFINYSISFFFNLKLRLHSNATSLGIFQSGIQSVYDTSVLLGIY